MDLGGVMAEGVRLPQADEARPAARWRRLVALVVDTAILGLPALGLGIRYFDAAAALRQWGLLVGLIFALFYFTVFDSWWAEGRSPGKRLLRIAVIGTDGALLTPPRAALRFLILYIPVLLGRIAYDSASPALSGAWLVVTSGLLLSSIYLVLFNRSRRSLHDLITGAIVVDFRTAPAPLDSGDVDRTLGGRRLHLRAGIRGAVLRRRI